MRFRIRPVVGSLLFLGVSSSFGILAVQNLLPFSIRSSDANTASTVAQPDSDTASKRLPPQPSFELTLQEAIDIAVAEIEGKPYSVEQEIEDAIPIIEVDLSKYEVVVHGQTGDILLIEDEEAEGDIEEVTEALSLLPYAKISLTEALAIAEEFAGKQPNSVELENEDGNLVYEVIFGLQKIYVDAGNGEVLYSGNVELEGSQSAASLNSSVQLPAED